MERNFAAVMSELRHARGLSQRKVAADLKISQALLSHYENGAREPGLAFVCRACDYYGVSGETFQFTCYKVFGNDTAGTSVDDNNVLHFVTGEQFHCTYVYLAAQCRVSTQQQLLAGLAFSVECT